MENQQIGHMLVGNHLPSLLKQLLANPKILKVGHCVTGDLKYLEEACRSQEPFVGGVDLARLAKDRFLVKTACVGLAELCAVVVGKRLNKNVPEHISSSWDDADLSPAQVLYAALDAYASLCIYNKLMTISSPMPLSEPPTVGLPVLLFNNDRTQVLASGIISMHQ
jgi:ribonuclease D